ncbi:hypothetical protein BDV26DRAFT_275501 [Aspergillus bertholletiae]|uniref:Uncharacterized protein n=1 Tax=Aspergillus bertholletiae TaxID=1226010 RepID=A0A5N7ART2_9EURO|nr:hypothetical protein BDV26DRAFT_275501 [Aspergillus bertholletiae]
MSRVGDVSFLWGVGMVLSSSFTRILLGLILKKEQTNERESKTPPPSSLLPMRGHWGGVNQRRQPKSVLNDLPYPWTTAE